MDEEFVGYINDVIFGNQWYWIVVLSRFNTCGNIFVSSVPQRNGNILELVYKWLDLFFLFDRRGNLIGLGWGFHHEGKEGHEGFLILSEL